MTMEILDLLSLTGTEVQNLIRNYKKDSESRKNNVHYYQERLHRLQGLKEDFLSTNAKLKIDTIPEDHDYFKKDYINNICALVTEYEEIFQRNIAKLENQASSSKKQADEKTSQPSDLTGFQSDLATRPSTGIIRRFAAKMSSLERLMAGISDNTTHQPHQYWQAKRESLQHTWHQLEDLHDLILDQYEDPLDVGVNLQNYIDLEQRVQEQIIQLALPPDEISTTALSQSQPSLQQLLPLPKLVIPRFDGDYLKWSQFFDLFSHMVDKQVLPNVQKMYYLKSHVTGEAERLISHFTVSEENYCSAWALLQDRYSNKRVLASSLIQKILNQPIDNGTASSIKALHDTTQECLLALNNIGIKTNNWDPLLLHLLIKKLDRNTHMRYEQSISKPREVQSIQEFLAFMEIQFQSLEALGSKGRPQITTAKTLTSVVTPNNKVNMCTLCKIEAHPMFSCKKFLSLNPSERLKFVKGEGLCINCLKHGHMAVKCTSRSCTVQNCGKKHNTLLHLPGQALVSQSQQGQTSNSTNTSTTVLTTSVSKKGYVVLGTVQLNIASTHGNFLQCRAILDSGSQINLMTEKLAKKLQLDFQFAPISIEGIGKCKKSCQNYVNANVCSLHTDFTTNIKLFVTSKIISNQPNQQLNISTWNIPSNITLADPRFHIPGDIDMLIGAELYHKLLTDGRIQLADNLPILQNTVFGWLCCGKIDDIPSNTLTCGICSEDEALDSMLTKFWKLDEIQHHSGNLSEAERQCEEHFVSTTRKDSNGRFVVRMPFNANKTLLGDSIQGTTNRFHSIERRLMKNPDLKIQYINFMREYEELGHMEKISQHDMPEHYYVIPHHCVIKPDSTTTKLRVVFDASAKTSSGVSLNDITHSGPVVQSDLTSILLRFRIHRFVFTTDVEKMYRQIQMHPDDQNFQIIQWRENPQDKLQLYRLKTVTYGTRSAPYLATKCLQQLSIDFKYDLPLGSNTLNKDFYVDDGLSGSNSLVEALEVKRQLIQIMSSAGFKLRKWCANHVQLLEGIPPQDQEVNLDFDNEATRGSIKTLGLIWIPGSDELRIRTCQNFSNPITKRTVTSEMARIYDPLGLISPVIVKAKIFIQGLWQMKIDWDTEIPRQQQQIWSNFRDDLNLLNDLHIPRHVFRHKQPKTVGLHVFTDASEKAYGAAVYARSENKDGTITVQLLCSKSRVAPLKKQTIPRLELCAALLGAELINKIQHDLQWHNSPVHMWTDSEIVLHWINADAASFQTFVAHRVSKIQELTSKMQWRHVSSKDNPADIVSRGLNAGEIKECTIWFYGPLFLHGQPNCWPKIFTKNLSNCNELEIKRKSTTVIITSTKDDLVNLIYGIDHKGSITHLQRVIGYMRRFALNSQLKGSERSNSLTLSTNEINDAMIIIIKAIQQSEFMNELKQLSTGKQLKPNHSLGSLTPFVDPNGLLRVGGRLQNAALPFDARHPILLPYNDPITKLIMRNLHEHSLHCGPQALLAQTRQKFWPIKGKIMARSVVQHCVRCTRSQPKLFNQIMGDLPQNRVQLQRPFLNTGVDFCGPIWIHYKLRGKRPCKAYIAVFCCFATKAVHLELVSDLTTEAFIGALNRFIYRRGRCQNIYCDNATNFVGARNQLQELEKAIYTDKAIKHIHDSCSTKGIEFHFIPPRAPHFGGLWEAAVKSAKHLLLKGVGNVTLTYEELETVIVQIEGILNSRPITPMSSDPNDLAALTPGHFLIGEPITSYPTQDKISGNISTLQRWKLVKYLKDNFWTRWSTEYLNELQHRTKWKTQAANVEPGTLVIIKEDNIPTLMWPLGRIIKTIKGNDGIVRVVEVKTSSGIFKRAIHRLAPLFPEDHSQNLEVNQTSTKRPQVDRLPINTPENLESHTREKRAKLSTNIYMTTLIAFILCLPMVLSTSVNITKYTNQPGIHFESTGKNYVISSYWNLVIYYDLQPLKNELLAFKRGTKTLRHTCDQIKHDLCDDLIPQFSQVITELESDIKLFTPSRIKRGAVNIVGNIANSVFGILDADYAEKMSQTIKELENNENFLLELHKNQTSIIDSTINVIKTDQQNTKNKFNSFDKIVDQLKNEINSSNQALNQQRALQSLLSLAIQLIITTTNMQKTQATIMSVLTDVHHGQVGPLLLSPNQLKEEIIKIKAHLPPSVQFPVQTENLLGIYKLMSVQGGIATDHVIFNVRVPLIDTIHEFNMYKIYPIPARANGTMMTIEPTTEIIAITAHGDNYYPITQEQLNTCMTLSNQVYLCPLLQPINNKDSANNLCEVHLFKNETTLPCQVREITSDQWTQIGTKNQWIYALEHPMKVTAVCGSKTSQYTLEDSGLLELDPQCIIKHDKFTLLGHQTFSSSVVPSITSHNSWKNLHDPKNAEPILLENAFKPYNTELKELQALQDALKGHNILQLPNEVRKTNYHMFGVGYTSLILLIILSCYTALRNYKRIRNKIAISNSTPNLPQPSARTTSAFTVRV